MGMFFARKKSPGQVVEGSVFERNRGHDITERARVVWVGKDPVGIPHVRFEVSMNGAEEPREERILAVDVFTNLYQQKTAPVAA